jgi:hypothetical protein
LDRLERPLLFSKIASDSPTTRNNGITAEKMNEFQSIIESTLAPIIKLRKSESVRPTPSATANLSIFAKYLSYK